MPAPKSRSPVTSHQPLANVLSNIGYFESRPTIAVAVSGGADSMALLLLAHEWASTRNGRAVALTVDHGLRKKSADEAKQVASWCKSHDIEHHILIPENWKPETAIQEKARDARYNLLTDWCKENNVLHLLTAHHAGDQTETFFFRLARGSFIEGLSCIPAVSTRSGVRLLRPLLGVSKTTLEDFLRARKQPWVEDPSNQNPHYTRNRIRQSLASEDLNQRVFELTQRIGTIRHHLEHSLANDLCHAVDMFPDGTAILKENIFSTFSEHRAMKILSALVQTIGGLDTQPRTEQVQLLYADLKTLPKRRALGGVVFQYSAKNHCWRLEKEHKSPHITPAKPLKSLAGTAFLGLNGNYHPERSEGSLSGYN